MKLRSYKRGKVLNFTFPGSFPHGRPKELYFPLLQGHRGSPGDINIGKNCSFRETPEFGKQVTYCQGRFSSRSELTPNSSLYNT